MANFFDQFDAAPQASPQAAGNFFDQFDKAGDTSVMADVGKSAGIGAVKGGIGAAGMMGDVRNLASAGVDYAGKKLGFDPEPVKNVASFATGLVPGLGYVANNAPSSQDIQSKIEGVTGDFYKPKTTAGEYAQTAGEFLPAMVGGPEGVVSKLLGRVALPAAVSETAGQLTKGTAAEPYARIAGAMASPLATAAARRAITPLPASAERQAMAATLDAEGVPLTAGQRTGSKPLQWMESALGDTPGSGGAAARIMENQGEKFTAAALKRAGETADRATPEVVDRAFKRIGNDFETVGKRNNIVGDYQLQHDLGNAEQEYMQIVSPSNRAPVIERTVKDIQDLTSNRGVMSGEAYNSVTSRLATQARNTTDPQLRSALHDIRSALDDAMERSIAASGNKADFALLKQARNQYRNLMVLEKAATGAGQNAAEGLISPSQLRNATVQQSRRDYARGRGDFAGLARAGEAMLKPLPNSGTSPRHNVTHMLQTIGAIVGGAGGAAGGPAGAAAGAIGGLAAPAVAGRLLLSKPVQAYLSNQVLGKGGRDSAATVIQRLLLASQSAGQTLLPGYHP